MKKILLITALTATMMTAANADFFMTDIITDIKDSITDTVKTKDGEKSSSTFPFADMMTDMTDTMKDMTNSMKDVMTEMKDVMTDSFDDIKDSASDLKEDATATAVETSKVETSKAAK